MVNVLKSEKKTLLAISKAKNSQNIKARLGLDSKKNGGTKYFCIYKCKEKKYFLVLLLVH